MDKMREEFEALCKINHLSIDKSADGTYNRIETYWAWTGFESGRLTINKPGKFAEYPDDNHGEYGKGYNDCHDEWEAALGISEDPALAAGLKVIL